MRIIKYFNKDMKITFEDSNKLPLYLGQVEDKIYFSFPAGSIVPENARDTTDDEISELTKKSNIFRHLQDSMYEQFLPVSDIKKRHLDSIYMLYLSQLKVKTEAQKAMQKKLSEQFVSIEQLYLRKDEIQNLLLDGVVLDYTNAEVWKDDYVLPTVDTDEQSNS